MLPQTIAVIGSGISGLSAAWLLSQRHHVILIEASQKLGGHSNTVNCQVPEGEIAVDAGFIVYNDRTYPNLKALFEYLEVPTSASHMGFAVSLKSGQSEYAGASASSLLGHARNLFDLGHLRMLRDLVRYFRNAAIQGADLNDDITLGQFLSMHGYSQDFVQRHLLPMAGAIWSCEPEQMLDYPATCFLRFSENHGLLNFYDRPQWRTVMGGSVEYINRLVADSRMRILTKCRINRVERSDHQVTLFGRDGYCERFDSVVIAAHADQALAMLAEPSDAERKGLSAFSYARNSAVLHCDESLMPKRKKLWSSWNYVDGSVTYWMNALQPLATKTNIFVTLNPRREPLASKTMQRFAYDHPSFSAETSRAQKNLWSLQGVNRTWFCGAHFGAGFHEDGLQAGLAVAEQLGGVLRPWNLAQPDSRIHVTVPSSVAIRQFLEAAE